MSNTLNMTSTVIASTALKALNIKLAPILGKFTTDFSTEAFKGGILSTRVVPASGAAVALADYSNDRSNANVSGSTTTTAVNVTMVEYGTGFYLDDFELAGMEAGKITDTHDKIIAKKVNALGSKLLALTYAKMTASNFSNSQLVSNAFSYDTVAGVIRPAANVLGFDTEENCMILNSTYAGYLRIDDKVSDPVRNGVIEANSLGNIAGFDTIEDSALPDNSEYLVGFCATPSALVVCARPTLCSSPDKMTMYEVVQDPETGLVLTVAGFYSPETRRNTITVECMFGVEKAVAGALIRLKTA